jgi:hypothetical protein
MIQVILMAHPQCSDGFETVIMWSALWKLLIFHVPNIIFILCSLDHLPKNPLKSEVH